MANDIVLWERNREKALQLAAEARSVPQVKEYIHNAKAWQTYARAAKDKTAEADAWEVRVTCVRRIGEMLANGKEDRAPEGRPKKINGSTADPFFRPTLGQAGVDKHLADRGRKYFDLKDKAWGLFIIDGRADVERSIERTYWHQERRKERHERIRKRAVAEGLERGPFPLIYADPPWIFETHTPDKTHRMPDDHYPTMSDEEICGVKVYSKRIEQLVTRLSM